MFPFIVIWAFLKHNSYMPYNSTFSSVCSSSRAWTSLSQWRFPNTLDTSKWNESASLQCTKVGDSLGLGKEWFSSLYVRLNSLLGSQRGRTVLEISMLFSRNSFYVTKLISTGILRGLEIQLKGIHQVLGSIPIVPRINKWNNHFTFLSPPINFHFFAYIHFTTFE